MNIYRETITVAPDIKVKARVYVIGTEAKVERYGYIETAVLSVTIPASQRDLLPGNFREFEWRGATFYRKGLVIPIVALGKVDHYEITATSQDTPE